MMRSIHVAYIFFWWLPPSVATYAEIFSIHETTFAFPALLAAADQAA